MSKQILSIRDTNRGANPVDMLEQFYHHLSNNKATGNDIAPKFNIAEARRGGKPLQKLWQISELSAHDFADETARFFGLSRIGLPELMAAASLGDKFSPRFLRESSIFAYLAGS